MALPSGLGASLGVVAEDTWGTEKVVTRFWEFNSESIKPAIAKAQSMGMMAGASRFPRTDRRKTIVQGYSGDVEFDLLNKGFGLFFEQALGQNTISGASANKTHTCIPDANAQLGKSLTMQINRPDITGTNRVFTYRGGKIVGWTLAGALDEVVKLTGTFDFAGADENTSLASPSYTATQEAFILSEAAITLGGSSVFCSGFSIQYTPGLKTDRRGAGNTKREQIANAHAEIKVTLDGAEFESLTQYQAFIAGTQSAFVLTLTSSTVIPTTAVAYSVTVTIPKVDFDDGSVNVGGPDIIPQTMAFTGTYDGSTAPITVAIVTSDTTS